MATADVNKIEVQFTVNRDTLVPIIRVAIGDSFVLASPDNAMELADMLYKAAQTSNSLAYLLRHVQKLNRSVSDAVYQSIMAEYK